MASVNPFDLLVDDDAGDPSVLLAAYEQKLAAAVPTVTADNAAATTKPAKLPSKPLPPTQAVREARTEGGRGRGGSGGRGYGRGGRGSGGIIPSRENPNHNENGFSVEATVKPYERRNGFDDARGRGGRRGGFTNGDIDGERPKRNYERRSGTGRGSEIKRDGAGRGNWGTTTDDIAPEVEEPVAENEVNVAVEKLAGEEENGDAVKENKVTESEEKEPEEKQMTLEEYEKVREEKRKALLSLSEERKGEERKVDVEKEFQAMHLVSKKKIDDEVFIKLGSEKEKRREAAEREEKAKKSVSINEFLKPAEGESYYRSGGRGRGRERGGRGGRYGGASYPRNNVSAPSIQDPSQFPTLGGK